MGTNFLNCTNTCITYRYSHTHALPHPQDILNTHSEGGRDEDRGSSEDIYLHIPRFPYFELEDNLRKQDDEVKPAKEIDPETKDVFDTLVRGVS